MCLIRRRRRNHHSPYDINQILHIGKPSPNRRLETTSQWHSFAQDLRPKGCQNPLLSMHLAAQIIVHIE